MAMEDGTEPASVSSSGWDRRQRLGRRRSTIVWVVDQGRRRAQTGVFTRQSRFAPFVEVFGFVSGQKMSDGLPFAMFAGEMRTDVAKPEKPNEDDRSNPGVSLYIFPSSSASY